MYSKILTLQEQEDIIRASWIKYSGGDEYRIILGLLDKGYTLTPATVALLCVNQTRRKNTNWFADNCHHFKSFTVDAIKLLKTEVDIDKVWESCVDDIRHLEGTGNYKLAYYLKSKETKSFLSDRKQWEEIFSLRDMPAI